MHDGDGRSGDHTEDLSDPVAALRDSMIEAAQAAPMEARAAADRVGRRWFARAVLVAGAVAAVVAVPVSVLALSLVLDSRADISVQDAEIDALRAAAEQAKPAGDAANRQLEARGQEPVPIPEPGEGDDTDVLVSAVAAQVLAQIPDPRPAPAELGAAIATVLRDNPDLAQVPVSTVSAALAGYLATNPPPPGPAGPTGDAGADGGQGERGERGEKGDPPTAAEIQNAFAAFIDANPDYLPAALCRATGPWTRVELRGADGGTVTGYLCVTDTTPPTETTEPPGETPLLPLPGLGG